MKNIQHIKGLVAMLFCIAVLCSFNYTSGNTPVALYTANTDTMPCFLVISDIHLHAGLNQDKAECKAGDAGDNIWQAAKDKIRSLNAQKRPGFLIVLGDLPFHFGDNGDSSMDRVHNSFETVCQSLNQLEKQINIPIIVVPGNNDAWDGDYSKLDHSHFPFFYPGNTALWADSSAKNIVCYSVYPLGKSAKLRVIVLNTVIFSSHKGYGASKNTDADAAINWLRTQLDSSVSDSDKVIIAMHIPPGTDGYNKNNLWFAAQLQDSFLNIIDSFKSNIIGLLSSHSHMDGIRLLVNDTAVNNSNISALLISVPGIAPGHGNNPAVKLIEYNPEDGYAITNFTTYYMQYWNNENYWKKPGKILPSWNDSFSFRRTFNPPLAGNNLLKDIKAQDTDALKRSVKKIYTAHGKPDTAVTIDTAFIAFSIYATKMK
jgi:hypothetical protein